MKDEIDPKTLRSDGKIEYGYLYDCFLGGSGRAANDPMFLQRKVVQEDVGETIMLPYLKGYAIIPKEEFNRMRKICGEEIHE